MVQLNFSDIENVNCHLEHVIHHNVSIRQVDIALGELTRFTRSGGHFGTFWIPERFCLMNFTAI